MWSSQQAQGRRRGGRAEESDDDMLDEDDALELGVGMDAVIKVRRVTSRPSLCMLF